MIISGYCFFIILFIQSLLSSCQGETEIITCGDSSLFETGFCLPSQGFNYPNCYQKFPQVGQQVPEGFTVAFFGDQGIGPETSSKSVLDLISSKKTDLVIHAGDFDYEDDPSAWDDQINDVLGEQFNYISAVGNHDLNMWRGFNGYQSKIFNRLMRTGARCIGSVGLSMICSVSGLTFFIGGPQLDGGTDTILQNSSDLTEIIEAGFNQFGGKWRFCVWHFNRRDYQIGGKPDEVGIDMYEKCREMGAIIINAHDHSYARTHLLSNFENHTIASNNGGDGDLTVTISKGESIILVVGTGGKSITPCEDGLENNPWFRKALCSTSDPPLNFGALFCSFSYSVSNQSFASCWFEEIDGVIRDEFNLMSEVSQTECCQPNEEMYCFEPGIGTLKYPFLRRTCAEEPIQSNCGINISCGCPFGDSCFSGSCWCVTQECSEKSAEMVCSREVNQCVLSSKVTSGASSSGNNSLSAGATAGIVIGVWFAATIILVPAACIFVYLKNKLPDKSKGRRRKR